VGAMWVKKVGYVSREEGVPGLETMFKKRKTILVKKGGEGVPN
jgi:hypothetical protein